MHASMRPAKRHIWCKTCMFIVYACLDSYFVTVNGQPKTEWPELVGKTADEAKQVLEREAPGRRIVVLRPGMCITADYRTDRIKVWLDADGMVARPPRIG